MSLSKKIKTFYCHLCRHKKRSLAIKYKSKFQDFLNHFNKTSNQNKLANSDESFVKFLKETKVIINKINLFLLKLKIKKI